MTVRLSVAVAAHPRRLERATRLVDQLPSGTVLALDPEPAGPPTAVRAAERAWSAIAPECTHHLVLQDDVDLCENFIDSVVSVLEDAPSGCISLHTGWMGQRSQYVRIGALSGARLVKTPPQRLSPQAVVLRAEQAESYARVLRAATSRQPVPSRDSLLLSEFLHQNGLDLFQTVPSLVQHDAAITPSLLSDTSYGIRRAALFGSPGIDRKGIADPAVIGYLVPGARPGRVYYQGESLDLWPWVANALSGPEWFAELSQKIASAIRKANPLARHLADDILVHATAVSALPGLTLTERPLDSPASVRSMATLLPGYLFTVLSDDTLTSLTDDRIGEILVEGVLTAHDYLSASGRTLLS